MDALKGGYSYFFPQPKPKTKGQLFLEGSERKLIEAKNTIADHKLNELMIQHIDKVSGSLYAGFQLWTAPWTTALGLISGSAGGFAVRQMNDQIPEELRRIIQVIEEIWRLRGVPTACVFFFFVCLFHMPIFTAFCVSVLTGNIGTLIATSYADELSENKRKKLN